LKLSVNYSRIKISVGLRSILPGIMTLNVEIKTLTFYFSESPFMYKQLCIKNIIN